MRLYENQGSLAVKERVNRLDKVKSVFAKIFHCRYSLKRVSWSLEVKDGQIQWKFIEN